VSPKDYEDNYEPSKPISSDPEEMESVSDISPTKIVKGKQDKKKKKTNSNKAVRRGGKPGKEGKIEGRPSGKKLTKYPERQDYPIPTKKPTPPPKGSLASFLDYFVNRRRLLVRTCHNF
ncbi:hypothetical protein ATANTOWER_016624, partial [Ataeniobius toweri]|nr:hypothetical protein [Ataeniobius toweri]